MYYGNMLSYFPQHHLSPLKLWVRISPRRGILDTPLRDKVCQWLAADRLFSPGTQIFSTNKTDRHDITEILLKLVLNTTSPTFFIYLCISPHHEYCYSGDIGLENTGLSIRVNYIWYVTARLNVVYISLTIWTTNLSWLKGD